jgi:hypothetical protein
VAQSTSRPKHEGSNPCILCNHDMRRLNGDAEETH